MKSRIAIFSGYSAPFRGAPRMGAPIFDNPSRASPVGMSRYGRALGRGLGRRGYYVPAREESWADSRTPHRKAYRVKAKRNTPAMKRAQKKFKLCARKCSTKRGARKSFPSCMAKCVKRKKR